MKKYRHIFGSLLIFTSFMAPAQENLDGYLRTAAENNAGLKARFNEYLAALEVAPQVKALPDPQVAFAYFISPVETRVGPQQFRFSATQLFPWFGTLKSKENVAVQEAKVRYEVFLEARSTLFNEVRSTYYNIYYNRRAVEITRENLDILGTFRNLANIKVKAGKVSAVDEYRIEMEIGDLENQLALILDKQELLEVMFMNLLNLEDRVEIYTPDELWTTDLAVTKDQVLDSIRSGNNQLLVLSLQRDALDYREELAENLGKPAFSMGFDYLVVGQGSNQFAGTDAFIFPRIGISIPLYRNKYKAMVNEVVYLREAKDSETTDKFNMLETMLENAWKDYLDAGRRIHLYMKQVDLAGQSLNLLETEYFTDNKDFEEILRMERKILDYGLRLEKARSDKQAAISFINYLMGK